MLYRTSYEGTLGKTVLIMKPSKFTAAAPAPHPSLKPKPGDEIRKALSLNPKPLNPKPPKPKP